MVKELQKNLILQFTLVFFLLLTTWWISIYLRGLTEGGENNIYTLSYPLLSILGAVFGIITARKWGGFHSKLGKAIYFLSLGLLSQFFGQLMYAYYIYFQGIEVPYPSVGDIGYFGSVLLYTGAVYYISQVVVIRVTMRTIMGAAQAFLIPFILLACSYTFFLQGYHFDFSDPLKILLDFGYPLGDALYVSLAILVFLLSRRVLGGVMKNPMQLLILALLIQYFSDFMFLYQSSRGTWYVAGINDFLYSVAYFVMTVSLVYIGSMFERIKNAH
jgi:hypothetical protein